MYINDEGYLCKNAWEKSGKPYTIKYKINTKTGLFEEVKD